MELRDLDGQRSNPSSALAGRLGDERQADTVLNTALDAGITFLDTAWAYSRSEEFIGRYVSHRRDTFTLATKAGHLFRGRSDQTGWTPEALRICVEESLRRLRTGTIDIVQLHNPTPGDLADGACIAEMNRLRQQGKFRFLGISSGVPHIDHFLALGVFDTIQVPFSLVFPENTPAIRAAAAQGVGVIARSILGEGAPLGAAGGRALSERLRARWDRSGLGNRLGPRTAEVMLRFALAEPAIHVGLFGSANPAHVRANAAAAARGPLDPISMAAVRTAVAPKREAPEGL